MPINRTKGDSISRNASNKPAMRWSVEYVKDGNFVRVVLEGKFNLEDQRRMIDDIISRDFWQPGMSALFDNRKLEYGATTVELMKKAGANHLEYDARIGGGKAALLMKSTPDFMRGRQYEIITEGKVSAKVGIFSDETKALNWLRA